VAEGIQVTQHDQLGIAVIQARRGVDVEAVGAVLGLIPPVGPCRVGDEALALIGSGPGTWLATCDSPGADWPNTLIDRLAGLAFVTDQSAGYGVLRVTGEGTRALLQSGAPIDLHPASFHSGSSAATEIAHIGVLLWHVDERPTFDLAVHRSYLGSLEEWIVRSASNACCRKLHPSAAHLVCTYR
jgi:sarcosine oxidase subunit gamma